MRPSEQRLQALRDYYLDNGDDWVDGEGDVADLFAEIEALEAEREEWKVLVRNAHNERDRLLMAEARLDKALSALREIRNMPRHEHDEARGYEIACAAIAETEGEAEPLSPDPRLIRRLNADGAEI